MQSRYPYKPSENKIAALQQKVSWLFDELSDNNASDNELSLSASVTVNKQISEVIPTLGNDAILVYTKLMLIIILTHMMAHSTALISLLLCKINTN